MLLPLRPSARLARLVATPVAQRGLYIVLLSPLGAAAEQNDEHLAVPAEVNSIAGTAIDPQLRNALAKRLRIRGIAFAKAINRNRDQRRRMFVEIVEPAPEGTNVLISDEFIDPDHTVPFMLPKGKQIADQCSFRF
jgi:hypothetical protein